MVTKRQQLIVYHWVYNKDTINDIVVLLNSNHIPMMINDIVDIVVMICCSLENDPLNGIVAQPNRNQYWHEIIQTRGKQTLSKCLNGHQHQCPHTALESTKFKRTTLHNWHDTRKNLVWNGPSHFALMSANCFFSQVTWDICEAGCWF